MRHLNKDDDKVMEFVCVGIPLTVLLYYCLVGFLKIVGYIK